MLKCWCTRAAEYHTVLGCIDLHMTEELLCFSHFANAGRRRCCRICGSYDFSGLYVKVWHTLAGDHYYGFGSYGICFE